MTDTRRRVLAEIADGPIAGPALAEKLGVSRAAVWKHVEALREAGFAVEGGDDGYTLAGMPEYGGLAVEFELDAPFAVEYHETIESTNDRARELATDGREDVVVLANRQTGGRGRLNREWSSPVGGVWASLLVRPSLPPARVPLLTLAAAVAVTRAAQAVGVDAAIKWPNDVIVPGGTGSRGGAEGRGDAKLAGVLTEMEGESSRVSWVVVGVGLNANVQPTDLAAGATSLAAENGEVDRRAIVQDVLETFDDYRRDPDAIVDDWRAHAATLGRRVRVETADGPVVGEAVDVTDHGALVVDDGTERVTVHAGDCEHLRPAE